MSKRYEFLNLGTVNAPYMTEIERAMARVLASGRFVGGAENEAFERELGALTGTAHAVGVSNGLDALRLIFRAYIELGRLRPGDEVIVPANTYIASVLAVTDAGLVPVLADPDRNTMNLSAEGLRKALTPRTRAVLTVHLYGRAAWDAEMEAVAREHDLIVVEDNAQAIGATDPQGRPTGSLGHAAAFSFYPTKNIGALGDAGAVTTDDPALAKAVRALANYGSTERYKNIYAGFNCRLDPLQAAVLRVKLPHLGEESRRRRLLADIYLREISNPLIELPEKPAAGEHVWHQFVVRTRRAELRDKFRAYLAAEGVDTDVHYPTPPHRQECYRELLGHESHPEAEALSATAVSLPVSSCTSPQDAREIAAIINNFHPDEI
ncbi:MAG: DegT/DnrJ/EryC1/StrS family aminotransferase [Muribaculaceae bacterium]|nr:DegT/DnrJ/EryC1/StrS family aminotransferase [Muribaculaceae bacterium]